MYPFVSRIGRRRALLGSAAVLVVAGALLAWLLLPLPEDSPGGHVVISTGSKQGVYQRYGTLLKDALHRDMPKLGVRLHESEGSQENVRLVATGKADYTIAAADAVAQYQSEHRAGASRLRGCARLYDDYVQLVVHGDATMTSVTQLKGKRVAIGQVGSGVRLIANRVLKAAGMKPGDIEVSAQGIDTAPEALARGDIDAFFWSGGLPTTSVQELSERTPIRFVPLGGLVEKLHEQGGPSLYYRSSAMPADTYPEAQDGKTVSTIAVANLLVTTDRLSRSVTEGLTRTVIDSRDSIGRVVHAAQLVDLRTALYTDPLELHEGAASYYRSVKP
ncbi:TAXI family TRAP transporter solute-binding subunit [Streptomyces sp. NPDC050560]|uniref:TAXI family TRAP transporter solute-binding subunit n=1 Tax=Streptomyces sp. NPDC050560 TaxID=3365630 RepID=UPI0037A857AE